MPQDDRSKLLDQLLDERIVVLDGAMGTAIQDCELTAEDFGGADFEGCNEHLVLTRPDVIRRHPHPELRGGARTSLKPNTFGATAVVLAEYDLGKPRTRDQSRGGEAGS